MQYTWYHMQKMGGWCSWSRSHQSSSMVLQMPRKQLSTLIMGNFATKKKGKNYVADCLHWKTYRGAWTAITLFPIRLWHCGQLRRYLSARKMMFWTIPTHIRLSVTLTLLLCNTISFLETWSFLALLIWQITLVSNIGARTDSIKKALTSWVVTRGGSNCNVSTGSSRGLCRLMRSRAGCSKSVDVSTVGRRYIRHNVRNTPLASVPGW